jgi:Flp pilus assembly protein TadD
VRWGRRHKPALGRCKRLKRQAAPRGLVAVLAAGALTLVLAGCGASFVEDPPTLTTITVQEPGSEKYFPSDEPYKVGAEHFNRGQYGLAERYFRDAVEKAPKDALAWVALASSYDRLSRFDLADRAYAKAIEISGETFQILNNQGYSHLLRGNLKSARAKFQKAATIDPNNITVLNNIRLLDGGPAQLVQAPVAGR